MQHPKRPRDPNALAKAVIGIATGEVENAPLSKTPGRVKQDEGHASVQESKGPRVSGAHLKAWYDLYRTVYGDDTPEAHSVKSAQGMFSDKSVSRERVRELRGPQKRGRKPTGS